ncbi:MAG: STAS domain-containing protein [Thermoleophilia bacterium]|nr:STAS domain-containing protein [Thermoleophilia bacterium]
MSSSVIRVREERLDSTLMIVLDGELDASSVSEVAVKLRRLVENQAERLVVDLELVTYLDSAGINLLFAIAGELAARQQQLHLVVVQGSPIERTLKIVGADRAFPVHATREAALAES